MTVTLTERPRSSSALLRPPRAPRLAPPALAAPISDSDAEDVGGADRMSDRWWVLHTRSRQEKRVVEVLEGRGISCYLPLVTSRRRYGRRRVDFLVPLFPGYVFLSGDDSAAQAAWKTNRVAKVLRVADQQQLSLQLAEVQRVIASGEPVDLYPALREGQRCRVVAGPLKGVEGVVLRRRGRAKLHVGVTFVGMSAVVEVEASEVEPIDGADGPACSRL